MIADRLRMGVDSKNQEQATRSVSPRARIVFSKQRRPVCREDLLDYVVNSVECFFKVPDDIRRDGTLTTTARTCSGSAYVPLSAE